MLGKVKIIAMLVACLCLFIRSSVAQMHQPVKWHAVAVPQNDGSEVSLVFTASLERGWHIYSQFVNPDGPLPTTFSFEENKDFVLKGKVLEESTPVSSYDKTFQMDIVWFAGTALFSQKAILHVPATTIKGKIEYMVCNDEMCLPPDVFEFSIEAKKNASASNASISQNKVSSEKKNIQASNETDKQEAHPTIVQETLQRDTITAELGPVVYRSSEKIEAVKAPEKIAKSPASLWHIFIGGLLGGFAAILMPCIFPMLPFTISYFTKKAQSRAKTIGLALLYGLSIIILYVGLGLLITLLFGADALNDLSTNGIFNFVFFLLLLLFSLSLLGAFEITLPWQWINKVDAQAERPGFSGIFFMAVTLALVSFSCTGPIIGTLLVEAATMESYLSPAVGMLGFSIALALPFTLFAMFPSWMNSLPGSGSWLNSVKVVLGFLELALALKFLSNVDLAYHWNWLDREVFLVLWIIIFALTGFYLLGKIRLSHDRELINLTPVRLMLAIITLAFTLYMVPGLWGAPLKVIAAFLPPQQTQDFDLYGKNPMGNLLATTVNHTPKKYNDLFHAPFNINAFFDYDDGMAYAKKMNKPVMIDFTGHACVNCRKMETVVWSDPRILNRLQFDYVVVQLYVDDKTSLPVEEQRISQFSGKTIKTIGNKWSDFQASVFGTNAQPYYVLLDPNGELLTKPRGADYNVESFKTFLDEGLQNIQQ